MTVATVDMTPLTGEFSHQPGLAEQTVVTLEYMGGASVIQTIQLDMSNMTQVTKAVIWVKKDDGGWADVQTSYWSAASSKIFLFTGPLAVDTDVKVTLQSVVEETLARVVRYKVFAEGIRAGTNATTITVVDPETGFPIADVDVWVTTDVNGVNVIASGRTDQFGEVQFFLHTGTVYLWKHKVGYNFTNPEIKGINVIPDDIVPPELSDIEVINVTYGGATIAWRSNEIATTRVEYGKTPELGSLSPLDTEYVLEHSMQLSGLDADTLYYFRVISKDQSLNQTISATYSFTTAAPPILDTTPPGVSAIQATDPTETTVRISWITDELATSQVEYGLTTAYGSQTTRDDTLVLSHVVLLSGLQSGTTYHFRVKSRDEAGNETISADRTFTTLESEPGADTTPPVFSNIRATDVTMVSAVIAWQTDEVATSQVEWGLTTDYGNSTTLDETLVASHTAALTGLEYATTYHYRVKSTDAAGNPATSGDQTFTTADAPTNLDLYGAGAYPYVDSIGPVGGGTGYQDVPLGFADYTPATLGELQTALENGAGKRIYLAQMINCSGLQNLVVPEGCWLYSGRGLGVNGGLMQKTLGTTLTAKTFLKPAATARITSLILEGNDLTLWRAETAAYEVWIGIQPTGAGVEIDNCEMYGWGKAAVWSSYNVHVHHCSIHNCSHMGYDYGYGVLVDHAYGLIEANIFDTCRNCVGGTAGGPPYTSWTTRYNVYGENCVKGHVEMMSGGNDYSDPSMAAGDTVECCYNTVKITSGWTPMSIRGVPHTGFVYHHNWFYYSIPPMSLKYIFNQWTDQIGGTSNQYPWTNITEHDNWFGETAPQEEIPEEPEPTSGYGTTVYTGSNPIGGGATYKSPHGYKESTADFVVDTASELLSALSSASDGDVIWIKSGTQITTTSWSSVSVPAGVAIASDFTCLFVDGKTGSSETCVFAPNSRAIFSGLRAQGASATAAYGRRFISKSSVYRIEIENCELWNFAWGAVNLSVLDAAWNDDTKRHWIHHCYIHNCQRWGFGYGLALQKTAALVEACIFHENRHHIMGQRDAVSGGTSSYSTNYEVRYCKIYDAKYYINGTVYYNHGVDCHGGNDTEGNGDGPLTSGQPTNYAGGTLKIHHNDFYENPNKQCVRIRGIPRVLCDVYQNRTVKTTHSGAYTDTSPTNTTFTQSLDQLVGKTFDGATITGKAFIHMQVRDNMYSWAG